MNANQDNFDLKLWQRYQAAARPAAAEEIDANELAAYLDGHADEGTIDRIEARMASDGAFLSEVLQLRQMRQAAPERVDEKVLAGLKALAPKGHPAKTRVVAFPQRHWWNDIVAWGHGLAYAATAAAVIVACLGGYALGQSAFQAHYTADTSSAKAVAPMTDLTTDAMLELPANTGSAVKGGGRAS